MRQSKRIVLVQAAVAAVLAGTASAASYTWNSASAGNWSDVSANGWNTGTAYPNTSADTATFNQDITANRTVTINVADARVGGLTLTDTTASHNWTIARSSTNVLTMDNGVSAATIISTTGANSISAPLALASNLDITVTGTSLSLSGGASGAYGITLNSASTGTLSFSTTALNDNLTTLTVNGGTLQINPGFSPGNNGITVNSGGKLKVTGAYGGLYDSGTVTVNGSGIVDYSTYSSTDWAGSIASSSSSASWVMGGSGTLILGSVGATFNGVISGGGSSGGLSFSNGYNLGGVNSYSGKISVTGRTLTLTTANSIANVYELALSNTANVKLDVYGLNQSLVSLSGGGTTGGNVTNSVASTATLTITGGSGKNFAGALQDGGVGKVLALRVNATGTQILSGTNTFTGGTIIDAGTLLVNGSLASGVTINGGSLGGTGTVAGVAVGASGKIAPGNSPGTLNSGNISLAGTLETEINGNAAGTGYDQLNVAGTVSLLAGSNLNFLLGYVPAGTDSFTLINNDGADAVTGTFATINGVAPVGNSFTATYNSQNYQFTIDYAGGDGNDVVVLVPEPGTMLAAIGLALPLMMRRRRVGR